MKEIVVCSGKGGTGKTSIVASFAALAKDSVLVDCDVDAADLHLILAPEIQRQEEFRSGKQAFIRPDDCLGCGTCAALCEFSAIEVEDRPNGSCVYSVDPLACEGCGVCVQFCPENAIDFPEVVSGEWFVSETRHGPLIHARLGIAAENSGKLVTVVRNEAKALAEKRNLDLLLVDGPPGIGCPVIASLTGADVAVVVTEPTVSGLHDLKRVVGLAGHFHIPVLVCVNKYDINETVSDEILDYCRDEGLTFVGKIPYDPEVTAAQLAATSVVEHNSSPSSEAIRETWENIQLTLTS